MALMRLALELSTTTLPSYLSLNEGVLDEGEERARVQRSWRGKEGGGEMEAMVRGIGQVTVKLYFIREVEGGVDLVIMRMVRCRLRRERKKRDLKIVGEVTG